MGPPGFMLVQADASRRFPLPDSCVQCCVTSPPYWSLRDYGTAKWVGGDSECDHVRPADSLDGMNGKQPTNAGSCTVQYRDICRKCGARRVDRQLGLEATPEEYLANMVGVFREVRRVLRDDGCLFVNMGDGYNAHPGQRKSTDKAGPKQASNNGSVEIGSRYIDGLKPKDLVGMPWRLALALQADGWYLRMDIIWSKPSPMPESVHDRPTKSHEYVFMLTKSARYFWDTDGCREPHARIWDAATLGGSLSAGHHKRNGEMKDNGDRKTPEPNPNGRNMRSVWTIASKPTNIAHFAAFPPELAARCIRAATSRKGRCPHCGKPWERVVSRDRKATRPGNDSKVNGCCDDSPYADHAGIICGNRDPKRHCTVTTTEGFRQSCSCPPHEPVPCLVMDCFSGIATTGIAAMNLGCDYVGLELSEKYNRLAHRRLTRPHAGVTRDASPDRLPLFAGLED